MITRALDRHSRSGAQDGFTLIELLVGLALLALTVALMPGTLRLGSRAWETRSDLERLSELASGLAILEQRIAEASPAFERSATGSIRISFTGDSHTLDFVSPTEIGRAGAGVYRYRLEPHVHALAGGASRGLVLRMSLYGSSALAAAETGQDAARLLVPEHASVRFRYFGSQPAHQSPQWHHDWQRPDALPGLLEVTIETTPGLSRAARRMLIAPRLDARQ